MIQSGGVLVKSSTTTVAWSGATDTWPFGITPSGLTLNARLASYGEIYRAQLWVSVVVNKRANAVARLPRKVYERQPLGRVNAGDTPFGLLMSRPSSKIDPYLFWAWTVSTRDTYGEAFWAKLRDAFGRPYELVPLHPTKVHDYTDAQGVTTWSVDILGTRYTIDRRDLVHFRTYNPNSMLRGMSPLEPLRATLENEDGARRANSALWANGGRPSVVLEHPSTLSDAAITRLSRNWSELHAGVDNWAKAAVLEEGLKATVLPLNVEELQYIEARKLNREEVVAAYDMPPPAVHILDRATFSNITEQFRSVYRDTIGPLLASFESAIESELRDGRFGEAIEPDFGDDVYFEWLLDEVLRGDFETRASSYTQGIQSGWLTPAEVRERENLPYIDGSDRLLRNAALVDLVEDDQLDALDMAFALQRMYLAVGVVLSPEEARDILNRAGAGLTGPAPVLPDPNVKTLDVRTWEPGDSHVLPPIERDEMRTVFGRLSRTSTLDTIDPAVLVRDLSPRVLDVVLPQLALAQANAETVDEFKRRLRNDSEG